MAVYVDISYQESLEKLKRGELTHAAHAMIYAKWPGALFGKYEYKYAVMVRLMACQLNCHSPSWLKHDILLLPQCVFYVNTDAVAF